MSADTLSITAEQDMEAITMAVLAGRPIPADVARRVEERSVDFRRRMIEEHGLQNLGVSLIRHAREAGR